MSPEDRRDKREFREEFLLAQDLSSELAETRATVALLRNRIDAARVNLAFALTAAKCRESHGLIECYLEEVKEDLS